MIEGGPNDAAVTLRPMRFDGERRYALALEIDDADVEAEAAIARAADEGAVLVYAIVDEALADTVFERLCLTSIGAVPELARAVRLHALATRIPQAARRYVPNLSLVLPFGGSPRTGVREIFVDDPRVTRLWDRFSIDVGVAIERNARWFGPRIFERPDAGYRVFVFEDGDRYVIRALCVFRTMTDGDRTEGHIVELLHDRSVSGMRAASHLVGLALRELGNAGADSVAAWSLTHSGSYPILVRHAFLPSQRRTRRIGVRALDPSVAHAVDERRLWYVSGLDSDRL